jgi:hypothetical protein
MSIHTLQPQIPTKVSRIQPRQGQSISETCHWGLEIGFIEIWVEILGFSGGVHVRPYPWYRLPGYPSPFIGNLDSNILASASPGERYLLALCDEHLYRREMIRSRPVFFNDST